MRDPLSQLLVVGIELIADMTGGDVHREVGVEPHAVQADMRVGRPAGPDEQTGAARVDRARIESVARLRPEPVARADAVEEVVVQVGQVHAGTEAATRQPATQTGQMEAVEAGQVEAGHAGAVGRGGDAELRVRRGSGHGRLTGCGLRVVGVERESPAGLRPVVVRQHGGGGVGQADALEAGRRIVLRSTVVGVGEHARVGAVPVGAGTEQRRADRRDARCAEVLRRRFGEIGEGDGGAGHVRLRIVLRPADILAVVGDRGSVAATVGAACDERAAGDIRPCPRYARDTVGNAIRGVSAGLVGIGVVEGQITCHTGSALRASRGRCSRSREPNSFHTLFPDNRSVTSTR